MNGTTYKRCGCRNTVTGKPYGQDCPRLRRTSGGWNPTHGVWHYQIELPATADGKRRPLRRGGYHTQTAAAADLGKVRDALAVADPHDTIALRRIGDLIDTATRNKQPIPEPNELRRILKLDHTADTIPDTDMWLNTWLTGRKKIRPGTRRSYKGHIDLHLTPVVAGVRLDRLRTSHVTAVFDRIEDRNELIRTHRTSTDPKQRDQVKGLRTISPATMHRIRATLRAALNGAIAAEWIDTNPAKHVELPPAKPPKPLVWTPERFQQWRNTGSVTSTVMVWTPAQTGAFLDYVHAANDRLYALYHLIAMRGLRRGEACGLHWTDVDLDTQKITIRWQITQLGWTTHLEQPKTDDSEADVALDTETVSVLRAHRVRQHRERLAAGSTWAETGLVFTTPTGEALHPADVTDHFHHLARQAGLPPIRLHDLRHGAATIALAAGVPMKQVQEMLRHSSITVTSDIYTTVLPELAIEAAEKSAAIIPRQRPAA